MLKPAEDRLSCKSKFIHTTTRDIIAQQIKEIKWYFKFSCSFSNNRTNIPRERRNGKPKPALFDKKR